MDYEAFQIHLFTHLNHKQFIRLGRETWSSGYERKPMIARLWVWIQALNTTGKLLLIFCGNFIVVWIDKNKNDPLKKFLDFDFFPLHLYYCVLF